MTGAGLLLLALAAPAAAQLPYAPVFADRRQSLALLGGAALPTGSAGFSEAAAPGPGLAVEYARWLNDWIAWGAVLHTASLRPSVRRDGTVGLLSSRVDTRSLALTARLNLMRGESWSPYVAGGGGFGTVSVKTHATSIDPAVQYCTGPGVGCGPHADYSSSAGGVVVTAAAGLEAYLQQGFSVLAEARFFGQDVKVATPNGTEPASIETINAFLGVRLWFGERL